MGGNLGQIGSLIGRGVGAYYTGGASEATGAGAAASGLASSAGEGVGVGSMFGGPQEMVANGGGGINAGPGFMQSLGSSQAQTGAQVGGQVGSITDSMTRTTPAPALPAAPARKPLSATRADQTNVEALVMSLPPELRQSFLKSMGLG